MKRKVFNFFRSLVLGSILCSYSFAGYSQSKLDSIQHLEEVVITSKSYKEVIPAQKLSGKELENLSSFSVADAIRYFSGVQVKDYGGVGGLKTVNIRSMGTNHTGVFYDGIQLGNAQNGQVDLGKLSLDNIEEISLYNGQKSEIFQSARDFGSSGTIYITSRRPQFKGSKTSNMKVTMKAGSFDLLNPSLLFEQKIDDNISVSFSGEWISSSGKYKFRYKRKNILGETAYDTTAVRQNGDINATRIEAAIHGYVENGSWYLKAYNYNSERGIPGAIVNNVFRRGERLWDTNSFLQGNFKKEFTPKLSTLINVKYAADRTKYDNKDLLVGSGEVENEYKQKEIYFSAANMYKILKNWDVSLSYDLQWNKLDADFSRYKVDSVDLFPYPTRYTHWVSLATAFEWKRLKAQASLLGTFVQDKVKRYAESPDKNIITPAIFVSYQPFTKQNFFLRAFYKDMFRMPTFNDLFYTDMGNVNLEPEKTKQYNVGFEYNKTFKHSFFKYFQAQVDAYYIEVKDKIVAWPKSAQFRWTMINLGRVETKGIDVSLQNTFQCQKVILNTKLQYTYQRSIDVSDPEDTYYRHQIVYIPKHSGSVIAGLSYKDWILNYSFIYTGERYNQQENIPVNHTQPWYTSDMTIMKQFILKSKILKVSAEINNLFSQDYDVILNYPMPKRNFRFTVSFEI